MMLMLRSFKTCYVMLLNLSRLKILLNRSVSGQHKETHPSPWSTHISLKKGTTTWVQRMLYKVEGSQLTLRISNAIPKKDCYLYTSENGWWVWQEWRTCFIVSPPKHQNSLPLRCPVAHSCHNYHKAKRLRNLLSKPWNSGKETMTCSYRIAGGCFNVRVDVRSHTFSTAPTFIRNMNTSWNPQKEQTYKNHTGIVSIPNLPRSKSSLNLPTTFR